MDKDIEEFRDNRMGNELYDIDDLPFTEGAKKCVLEYLAQKYWRILLDLGIQDGHCKSYDPLVIEGTTAHSYVFDMEDGGRHHDFKDLKHLETMLDDEIRRYLKNEPNPASMNELKAKNLS